MMLENKRCSVYQLDILPFSEAKVENIPSSKKIKIRGVFFNIPISACEFKEKNIPGEGIEQELKAVVTDTGVMSVNQLHFFFSQYVLLRLTMTNGDVRVVGSDQFPVLVSMELEGTPAKITLSFKRNSPEPAKIYSSF